MLLSNTKMPPGFFPTVFLLLAMAGMIALVSASGTMPDASGTGMVAAVVMALVAMASVLLALVLSPARPTPTCRLNEDNRLASDGSAVRPHAGYAIAEHAFADFLTAFVSGVLAQPGSVLHHAVNPRALSRDKGACPVSFTPSRCSWRSVSSTSHSPLARRRRPVRRRSCSSAR